jgi:hypothetical protein
MGLVAPDERAAAAGFTTGARAIAQAAAPIWPSISGSGAVPLPAED